LAGAFSVLLSPYLVAAATAGIVVVHLTPDASAAVEQAAVAMTFCSLIPLGFTMLLVRSGRATDIHAAIREQRRPIFAVAIAAAIISTVTLENMGAHRVVVAMGWAYVASGLLFAAVNESWKISMHTGVLSGSVVVLGWVFGVKALWLALLILLVGWSRLARQRHTLAQAVAGAFAGGGLTALVLMISA